MWYEYRADKSILMILKHHYNNKCFSKKHIPPHGPCWRPKRGHSLGYPPKREKTCPRCGRSNHVNFTPIGKAVAEKSVTVHKKIGSICLDPIWSDTLTSFCPSLQNHQQHIKVNSNYHQPIFHGDKRATKIYYDHTQSGHDLELWPFDLRSQSLRLCTPPEPHNRCWDNSKLQKLSHSQRYTDRKMYTWTDKRTDRQCHIIIPPTTF